MRMARFVSHAQISQQTDECPKTDHRMPKNSSRTIQLNFQLNAKQIALNILFVSKLNINTHTKTTFGCFILQPHQTPTKHESKEMRRTK